MAISTDSTLKRVVIIGGGFGGLAAAKRLRYAPVHVTLIDRHNYHLFQPLLYQVATGELSPANIASPLRGILRIQKNTQVLLSEVTDVRLDVKKVDLADGVSVDYDFLIVATGATHSYFGRDEWRQYAPGLKTIDDATEIRKHILYAFEQAEKDPNPLNRSKWMTFVIVGGGPTGVELAGALSEIANHTLKYDFRRIDPSEAKILLVEASENPLDMYPEKLTSKAKQNLKDLKVTFVNNSKVTDIQSDHVEITEKDGSKHEVETKTVIWAAGVAATPLARKLGEAANANVDRAGRVTIQQNLTLPGHDDVMVIGDMSSFQGEDGRPLPGLAPVAMQQGQFAARRIIDLVKGREPEPVFKYRDRGSMAVIGRYHAIAWVKGYKFDGVIAWLMWLFIHILMITQFRNRLLVATQWAWTFFSRDRSARLITGDDPD